MSSRGDQGGAGLPLAPGSAGDAVSDLQARLTALGHGVDPSEHGRFGAATEAAVRSFQEKRGLRIDGICDRHTWAALVEAGYRLGERLLYDRRPMLRGDDVAELQRRLGGLGFDAGRVDGIFGPRTTRALTEFQRNAGITVDGIAGPATLAALDRLGRRDSGADATAVPVGEVRERERLRSAPRTLSRRRVAIGHDGSLDALVNDVARAVAESGAQGVPLQPADEADQAQTANFLEVDVYLGFAVAASAGAEVAYWRSPQGGESMGGRRLAELLADELGDITGAAAGVRGMALPELRETRMPAIVCHVGPPAVVVAQGPAIAAAVRRSLERWVTSPVD